MPTRDDRHARAVAAYRAGSLGEAERAALALHREAPGFAGSCWLLGVIAHDCAEYDAAERWLGRAAALAPADAECLNSHGRALWSLRRFADAAERHRAALALSPGFALAHLNLAEALLAMGRFDEGWREYEWRFRLPETTGYFAHLALPEWTGGLVAGAKLLVMGDQGFGDVFHFARYVPMLVQRGIKVVLGCAPDVAPLLSRLKGIRVATAVEQIGAVDGYLPLTHLPMLLGTTLETIPARVPYLAADPARVDAWRARLAHLPGLRVGLAWAGRPVPPGRSIPFAMLRPLLDIEGASFVALQKGPEAAEAEGALDILDPLLTDFGETAAAIAALDLVLCIDSAVAHLAGALGVPAWVMLNSACDWRWMTAADSCPWYPGMRLFRQRRTGRWRGVVTEVATALARVPQ